MTLQHYKITTQQQTAPERHKITITSIMGVVMGDTDAMVTGVAISITNMLQSSLSFRAVTGDRMVMRLTVPMQVGWTNTQTRQNKLLSIYQQHSTMEIMLGRSLKT